MESFDGSSSFASFGFSPRGDGTVLMIDIFTTCPDTILQYCYFILTNYENLR